jgi:tetratricopeptide (TPR) repeat protein
MEGETTACPKCNRQVKPKRTCIYCGALLTGKSGSVQGLDAQGWVQEAERVMGEMNQLDRALGCYDKALKGDPRLAAAWAGKARIFAQRGERDEAIKHIDEALAIDPNDGQLKALRARLAQIPAGLPPGRRPSTATMSAAAASGAERFYHHATAALVADLQLVTNASEISSTNWLCAVPPHVGWPHAPREVLAQVFTKDGRAFGFYHTPGVDSVPPSRITDEELSAWGALLQSGRAHKVFLGANVIWSPGIRSRVEAVNERLKRLGAPPDAKIELIVISDL